MGLNVKLEEHCYIFGYPLPPALPSALMPVAAQNAYNTTTGRLMITFTGVKRYTDRNTSPMQWAAEIGRSSEMLNSLTSLDLSLQCDAFVVTLSSNWCRLIDELRATVRCKADHPLLDAQQMDVTGDYNLEWR